MKATFFALYNVGSSYHQSRVKSRLTVQCYEQETTTRLFELIILNHIVFTCHFIFYDNILSPFGSVH